MGRQIRLREQDMLDLHASSARAEHEDELDLGARGAVGAAACFQERHSWINGALATALARRCTPAGLAIVPEQPGAYE